MEAYLQIGTAIVLLIVAYVSGSFLEARHYRSIRAREERWRRLPAVTLSTVPASWQVTGSGLVTGSVVISVDYFKRFLAGLRGIIGGRIASYESLLDRARREALLRMKEQAQARGFDAIISVRIHTSRLANSGRNGQGTAGLEVLAVGTALVLREGPA